MEVVISPKKAFLNVGSFLVKLGQSYFNGNQSSYSN